MQYKIVFAEAVLREDVPALDTEIETRAREAIEAKLKTHPHTFGKPLRHSLRNHRSLRVGDFRIVYRVDGTIVRVIAVVHRRYVYKVAHMRIA